MDSPTIAGPRDEGAISLESTNPCSPVWVEGCSLIPNAEGTVANGTPRADKAAREHVRRADTACPPGPTGPFEFVRVYRTSALASLRPGEIRETTRARSELTGR